MSIEEAIKEIKSLSPSEAAIETLLAAYENTKSDLYEANNCISDLLDIAKKKDAVIDAMAEQLTTPVHNKRWVIEYFEKEVE